MDDVPRFRRFLRNNMYASHMDLTLDACTGGQSESFYEWALLLRFDHRTRYTLTDVRQYLSKAEKPHWWNPTSMQIFALWRICRLRCVPHGEHPYETSLTVGRTSRRALAPSGIVRSRPPDIGVEAGKAATELWNSIHGRQCVIWIDNWYRKQYTTDPLQQDKSLNLVMSAVLRTGLLPVYQGHPTNVGLFMAVPHALRHLNSKMTGLKQHIRILNDTDIQRTHVRVPLDVTRMKARSLQWRPFVAAELPPGKHSCLLIFLEGVRHAQERTTRSLPMCVDMKIHQAILKMLYSKSYQRWNMHSWLGSLPLAYGVWHPFKHCVTLIYRQFLGVLAPIERPHLQAGDKVPTKYKLQHMERTIATLLLVRQGLRPRLEQRLASLSQHP